MIIAICIIGYFICMVIVATFMYVDCKSKSILKEVDDDSWVDILISSLFFPIKFLWIIFHIIVTKLGDKLCKDH